MARNLSDCLRKAGALVPDELQADIIERAAKFREAGETNAAASRKAVAESLAERRAMLGEVETAAKEGRTLYSPAEPRNTTQPNGEPMSPVQQLAADRPDLEVRLPGDEKTMRLEDALKRIEAERLADTQFGDLVRVAAACALTGPVAR